MPTLFNRVHKKNIDLKESCETVSTLLIPESLVKDLESILPVSTTKTGERIYQF